jgi:probable phosphoglycerate mutase
LAKAERIGDRLGREPIERIFASPLERTMQTAQAIARRAKIAVTADERLIEIDFGRWTGLSFEQIRADPEWRAWNMERESARAPGGERMIDAQTRAVDFITSVPAAQTPVVAVSHGDVIRGLVCWALGLSLKEIHRLEISPGSLTTFTLYDDGAVKLVRMNETP